jgi:hypothetical protein
MPIKFRRDYLNTIRERYKNALKKKIKSEILNEFCAVCGYERKYAIRILNNQVQPRQNRPGPKPVYNDQVVQHLRILWESMNRMCAKKMVVAIPLWMPFYKAVDAVTKKLLLEVSASTIDRLLRPYKQQWRKGLSTTKSSLLKSRIPIQLLDHNVNEPGFMEADTVAHCGGSAEGTFASSLTVTDLFSGWTENRAVMTKKAELIVEQMKRIRSCLPFQMLGLATDNGSEFLNDEMLAYAKEKPQPFIFVRRRAYKKNDNAHVEQKNFTHVRELFGYERIEDMEILLLMNEIYQAYWNPMWNYFTPMMKLVKKERIRSKIKKTYDDPKTPYQRLIETDRLSNQEKKRLKELYATKNPFFLKQQLDQKLKIFYQLVEQRRRERKLTGSDS